MQLIFQIYCSAKKKTTETKTRSSSALASLPYTTLELSCIAKLKSGLVGVTYFDRTLEGREDRDEIKKNAVGSVTGNEKTCDRTKNE